MPKARPVSLHPLSFDQAVQALIRAPVNEPKKEKTRRKARTKKAK